MGRPIILEHLAYCSICHLSDTLLGQSEIYHGQKLHLTMCDTMGPVMSEAALFLLGRSMSLQPISLAMSMPLQMFPSSSGRGRHFLLKLMDIKGSLFEEPTARVTEALHFVAPMMHSLTSLLPLQASEGEAYQYVIFQQGSCAIHPTPQLMLQRR